MKFKIKLIMDGLFPASPDVDEFDVSEEAYENIKAICARYDGRGKEIRIRDLPKRNFYQRA